MSVELNPFWLLLVGLLVGWLIEWVIDWVYWRRQTIARTEYDALQSRADQWKTERDAALATSNQDANQVAELQQRLAAIQQSDRQGQETLQAAQTTYAQQQSELTVAKRVIKQQQVDLTAANEVIARHEHTIGMLNSTIAAFQSTSEQPQFDVAQGKSAPEQHRVAHATPAARSAHELEPAPAPAQVVRDPLVDIDGIGPVYQERLYAAGIYTFAQVAEQSQERLREVVAAQAWQDIEPEVWIAEAREFAQQVREGTYGKGRANGS